MIARPPKPAPSSTRRAEPTAPAPPQADEAAPAPADPIAAWLDVLGSLLRIPEAEKRSVRDELEGHLRERTRDLIVTGMTESHAAAKAIDELGDAALLAREYRAARTTPTRRIVMNLTVLGLAAGAMVTSLVALRGDGTLPAGVSVFQPPIEKRDAPTVRFEGEQDTTWGDLFEFLARTGNVPAFVHWKALEALSGGPFEQTSEIHVRLDGDFTLDRALELINEDLGLDPDNRIDYRVRDGRMVFASTAFFDRQETVLATYDLGNLVNQRLLEGAEDRQARESVITEVSQLIMTLVHSNQWADNGGDRASLTHYGAKLFVRAPKRFHPQIHWILSEVGSGDAQKAAGDDRAATLRSRARLASTSDDLAARLDDLAARRQAIQTRLRLTEDIPAGADNTAAKADLRALEDEEAAVRAHLQKRAPERRP